MLNIPDEDEMSRERFIQSFAKLMTNWGMPLTAARVLAYLLMEPGPVGLDQIAQALDISKAGAWTATRHLEQVRQIERFGEKGTKRALFAPTANAARSLFSYSGLLSRMGTLLEQGAALGVAPEAADRMRERSHFYLVVHDAIETTMRELMAERRRAVS